jgi:DNA-binding transcriptional MocR family regulator
MGREDLRRPKLAEVTASQLRTKISMGEYSGRLPSADQLAKDFGISRMTMINGLRQLAAEGIIITRQGSGTYIAGTPPVRQRRAEIPEPYGRLQRSGLPQQPVNPERQMSTFSIYFGLRLFTWTKQRLIELEYTNSQSTENLQQLEAAAARVFILDKIAEGFDKESENPLFRVGLINTFRPEIDSIRRFHTLGDALVALGETGKQTTSR